MSSSATLIRTTSYVAKKHGFKLMIEGAVKKLKRGDIDIKELIKVIAIKE